MHLAYGTGQDITGYMINKSRTLKSPDIICPLSISCYYLPNTFPSPCIASLPPPPNNKRIVNMVILLLLVLHVSYVVL